MADADLICFGLSCTGASHIKNERPNQDAFSVCRDEGKSYCVVSVCDGHGSEKYVRSALGSEFAAKEATGLMRDFVKLYPDLCDEPAKQAEEKIERLKRNILFYWREQVQKNLEENPISEDEYDFVSRSKGGAVCGELRSNPVTAYGTTLITAALTKRYVLCLQLGDGDITFLRGSEVSSPMEGDGRLFANETTSLCGDMAIYDFRTYFSNERPEMLMLSSDGVYNSFVSREGFYGLSRDIEQGLRQNGFDNTKELLERGLNRLSENGSGDDVTLALIYDGAAAPASGEGERDEESVF